MGVRPARLRPQVVDVATPHLVRVRARVRVRVRVTVRVRVRVGVRVRARVRVRVRVRVGVGVGVRVSGLRRTLIHERGRPYSLQWHGHAHLVSRRRHGT